jgi:predicted ATPase
VLRVLAERAQQLVSKQELFDRVWGGLAVSDDALTSCIQELRGALSDAARSPRYIETRHRRGYRLMVPAAAVAGGGSTPAPLQVSTAESARLVGRVAELDQLARHFRDAQSGRRQIVFVTGEAGIGKSALADTFLNQLRAAHSARTAHGQCLDHHGVGEPYLPLIEVLTRLAGGQDGTTVKQILSTQAPSWLAQMPSLWTPSERSMLEARSRPTRERMMRELYDRLPATRRALSHSRVGRRLEAAWTGKLDMIASELAEHFERGNELARAIPHHQRAAAKALRRSASEEAIRHLQRARETIRNIADDVERAKVEVELLIGLGAAFIAMRGFGAPEVSEAYSRAEALCECLGESAEIFPVLWGQWMYRWGRSEVDLAWRLCERLLRLAEKSGDAGLKLQAHHASWATSFGRGKLADVLAHAEAGLALYEAKIHQAMASRYGNHDADTCARYFSALSLAFAGEEERARSMADTALAAARGLNDPFTLGLTLYFASAVAQVLGDVALAAQHAEASMQLATEHDLAMLKAWSTGVVGWCAATSGAPDRGIALLTEAIAALQVTQSRHFLCYLLGLLAEAHMEAGHHTEAMKAVEDGITLAEAHGERYYDAELQRLRGELLARPPHGQKVKAAASFRAAIKIAKLQGAGTLERKATESLGHWSGRS